jgi:hypothetical protein
MEENPMGYISKIGVEGTKSLIGPNRIGSFRKSYTDGACKRTKSALANIKTQVAFLKIVRRVDGRPETKRFLLFLKITEGFEDYKEDLCPLSRFAFFPFPLLSGHRLRRPIFFDDVHHFPPALLQALGNEAAVAALRVTLGA